MAIKKEFSCFHEMIAQSNLPVLVDFYATWCGPCQMMAQVLEQVNVTMGKKVQIIKIDTDKYPKIASAFNIKALPTLILFKNGQPINQIEGVAQAHQIIQYLQTYI